MQVPSRSRVIMRMIGCEGPQEEGDASSGEIILGPHVGSEAGPCFWMRDKLQRGRLCSGKSAGARREDRYSVLRNLQSVTLEGAGVLRLGRGTVQTVSVVGGEEGGTESATILVLGPWQKAPNGRPARPALPPSTSVRPSCSKLNRSLQVALGRSYSVHGTGFLG